MTPPVPHDQMRIGDREREAMTERLATAHSAGQLTLDEFDERVTRTQSARTRGELDALDADLPRERGDFARRNGHARPGVRHPPLRWGTIALIVLALWIVSKVVFGVLFLAFAPVDHLGYGGAGGGISFISVVPLLVVAALAFIGVRRYRRARPRN